MQTTAKILFYCIALFALAITFWFGKQVYYFSTHNYSQIIDDYLLAYPLIYKPLVFKEHFFTPKTYHQARWWLYVGNILLVALNVLLWKYKDFCQNLLLGVVQIFVYHLKSFQKQFQDLPQSQKFIFAFVLMSIAWYQAYMYRQIFVAMDETFSWLFFASQGVFPTITHYPVPNNHVFYNLCSVFWSNFISDQILAMRLTSILSFWLLLLLIFYYFLRTANFQTAILAIILIGYGFSQSVFAVQGRGYMLMALCFFMALWSLQAYQKNRQKAYLVYFALFSIIGFWTIPVFLYVFLSFYAYAFFFIWWKEKSSVIFFHFFGTGLFITVWVYLCYCPILMYSGFSALAGNENVSPKTYDSAWFFGYILSIALRESVIYVISLPKYVSFFVFVLLGIFLWLMARKNQNADFLFLWRFLLISLPVTFMIICLMQTFPFYRIWTYYAILLAILVALGMYHFVSSKRQIANFWLLIFNVLMAFASYFQFWREIQDFYDPVAYQHHKKLENFAIQIVEKKQSIHLSVEAFYIRFWLEYRQATHLLRHNSCKADVAVAEIPEPAPLCQEAQQDIWFLRFYSYKQKK